MKRIGYIYEKIVDANNCKAAIINASKHKRNRKSVDKIVNNLDFYSKDLSNRLQNGDFITSYTMKTICDGSSKKTREIAIPSFYPDQCAHHAIVQVLMPIIKKSSYYWSCANIKKRGIKRAAIGVERATKRDLKHAKYCVQMDVRHFYPSVPHSIIKEKLETKIKDKRALNILYKIIDSYHSAEGCDIGIPIGNYTSPWFAELVLQTIDHSIKEQFGIKHYVRYADDMILIGNNKRKLRKAMRYVMNTIRSYGMTIKPNYQLYRILSDGEIRGRKIDFVGRCFGKGFTTIRKHRALTCMRQSRKIHYYQNWGHPISYKLASSFQSRCSCVLHVQSLGFRKKYVYSIDRKAIKEVIRNESKRKCKTKSGIG